MENINENTFITSDGDGELNAHFSSDKNDKNCMENDADASTENLNGLEAAMAPISPMTREVSNSKKSLSSPDDAVNVEGFSNQAFDESQLASDKSPSKPRPEASCLSEESSATDSAYRPTLPNQLVPTQNKSPDSNRSQNSLPTRGLSSNSIEPFSGKESCHSRGASTDGSTIDPSYPASVIESRRGTYSESGTLPIGMNHEGTPIIEENETHGKIIDENSQGNEKEKQTYYTTQNDNPGRWKNVKHGVQSFGRPFLTKHNTLPPDPTKGEQIKYAFSCPPHGKVGMILTYSFLFILFWGSLIYIIHDKALPGGTVFSIMMLVIVAQLGGILVSQIKLPPLLGMLVVGIAFRSIPGLDTIGNSIETEWSSSLRSMALVVILIRAGLGLDPEALRKLSFMVLRLAATPCMVETATVAVVSRFLLDFPWKWGFMLGFILAAVSPAVVVPCLLSLSDQGYGVEKGIPTLVIAAASIDDVLAISGFGVCLGLIFSKGSTLWQGFKGPMEFGMGTGYGIIVGIALWMLPNKNSENAVLFRFLLLLSAGLLAVFGSKGIDFGGAGALGCLCVAFVAGYGWRKQGVVDSNKMQVNEYFNLMWTFFQPLLFGLIGTEIRVTELHLSTVGWGLVTLAIGLSLRVVVSFFAVMGGNLNLKERIFVALAWLPKATVQAAIGSTALDYARDANGDPSIESPEEILGAKVLTIAVLVILITAPIGAIAIMLSAPKLLEKAPSKDEKKDVES